ncbi:uncharacterized protein TNCV_4388621 [Trichonephila clavipes]|nr:uncharacterized protein TNCV_4388621 [Trichonephila clavipes]
MLIGKLESDDIKTKQARDDAYVLIVETAIEKSEHRRTAVIVEDIDLLVILIRRIQTHQEEVLFKKVGKGNVKTQIYTFKSFGKYPHCKNKLDQNGSNAVTDIAVSFDGTWLTRGHISQIGVGCVVDTLTGYVIEFEFMSKYCPKCISAKNELGETTAEYDVWYSGHKSSCQINHVGTSGAMKVKAAAKIWPRSKACGFRHTTLLSDGDAKTHKFLNSLKIYGPDIDILKEECINHVSKRLGTSLRYLVKDGRAKGMTLGGKSYGSLKETTIKILTQYYQKAILENKEIFRV